MRENYIYALNKILSNWKNRICECWQSEAYIIDFNI